MELQWPLMLFTLFICLGAGLFGVTGLLAAFGKGSEIRFPALVASLVAVAIGGLSSALHLQHWDRIFNGFGNPSSGITQELIGIVLIAIAIVVYYIVSRKGETPKWMGWTAVVVSVVLVVLMSHSYMMAARPLWNNLLLYLFYLSNTVAFGALGVMVLQGIRKSASALSVNTAIAGGIVQFIAVAGYAILIPLLTDSFSSVGNYFDSTDPTKTMQDPSVLYSGFLTGEYAPLYWGGALVLGAVVPLACAALARRKTGTALTAYASVGLASALIGGIALRAILYLLGFTPFVFY